MEESWRVVIEGLYEVSNKGQVRSLGRLVNSTFGGVYFKEGRVLKQNPNPRGYLQVNFCQNGGFTTQRVHRVVAEAFLLNPEGLPEVNHKDPDTRNNNAPNLEWVTGEGNQQHALLAGVKTKGEKASNSKLCENDARDIKRQILAGYTNKEIAVNYGVHPGTVHSNRPQLESCNLRLSRAFADHSCLTRMFEHIDVHI